MKNALSIWLLMLISAQLIAQNCTSERYLSNIFQSSVSQDVIYGNSPALTAVYVAENVTVDQDMTMDVYFPVGDDLENRPLVILAYGGGYLVGTKEDEDVAATCDSLAKKGYVTASINYRMNMNVASSSSGVRAIYRAAQDYNAAIRYLKEYSNDYGIDTNYVFVGGVSAGGFSAMHAVFLDEIERPAATYQSGIGGINPDLGCVSCSGNSFNHTSNVRGIINLWGALMDTNFIQQDELVPMTLFHGTDDLIVPYDYGFPFTALFLMPEVYGSLNIASRVNNLGGNAELNTFPGVGHNIWGVNVNNVMIDGPTEHWSPITDSIISFLYENIRPEQPVISFSEPVCSGDTSVFQVLNMPQDGRACWSFEQGTIVSANSDSSIVGVIWQSAGTHDVSVVVFNHLDAPSITTTQAVSVFVSPVVSITDQGGTLLASGSYNSYQWYLDGSPIPGANQPEYEMISSGTYMVEAITTQGCSSFSEPLVLVGIGDAIISSSEVFQILAYDTQGRLVQQFDYESELRGYEWPKAQLILLRYLDVESRIIKEDMRFVTPLF